MVFHCLQQTKLVSCQEAGEFIIRQMELIRDMIKMESLCLRELYTSGINLNTVRKMVDVKARVYGPSGFGNWFSPSPLMAFSLNKWIVPEWQGYVGGVFHRMSVSTYHNIRQHLISGSS